MHRLRESRRVTGQKGGTMAVLWTIVAFAFTFGTLAVVVYGIVRALSQHSEGPHGESPTVDAGWRASWR